MCDGRRRRRGSVSVETLLALLITISILPVYINAYALVMNMDYDYETLSDELALNDLRRILLLSYDMEISEEELNFLYQNSPYCLYLCNEKLILTPGTQIFLSDIETILFSQEEGCIVLTYTKDDGREVKTVLGKKESFSIDDFSDIDDGSADDEHFDE